MNKIAKKYNIDVLSNLDIIIEYCKTKYFYITADIDNPTYYCTDIEELREFFEHKQKYEKNNKKI